MKTQKSGKASYRTYDTTGTQLGEYETRGELFAALKALNKMWTAGAISVFKVIPISVLDGAPRKPRTQRKNPDGSVVPRVQ